jgi:hypothetical protein
MSTISQAAANPPADAPLSFMRKSPWVGIMALLSCYAIIPVMHILMTGIAHWLDVSQFNIGLFMGIAGVGLIYVGTQRWESELYQTWMGFFAGNLIFTGWIEFGNDWWAAHLGVVPLLRPDGSTELLAGMRVFQVGSYFFACVAIVLMFNKESYCRAVVWIRKWLRMSVGLPTPGFKRNFALLTAWEIIAVTWCLYVPMLAMYDRTIWGPDHWVTYAGFFGSMVWGVYTAWRLFQFKRFAPSLRYAIPVSIILWVPVEIASEWRMFEEIWVHPWKYKLECSLIIAALVVFVFMARYTTRRKISVEEAAPAAA